MQEEIRKLAEGFKGMAHSGGPRAFFDATVLAGGSDAYTCDILLDDLERYEVRLRAVVSENSSIDILPAIGSAVVVGQLHDDDYLVIACDQIENWRLSVGATKIMASTDGVQISRNDETLEKLLTDLVTAVLTIAAPKDAATLTQLLIRIKALLK